jgi:hypothetical protein
METLQDLARKDAIPDHLVCFRHFVPLMEQGLDPIFRRAPHLLIASAAEGVPTREADVFIALSYFAKRSGRQDPAPGQIGSKAIGWLPVLLLAVKHHFGGASQGVRGQTIPYVAQ